MKIFFLLYCLFLNLGLSTVHMIFFAQRVPAENKVS